MTAASMLDALGEAGEGKIDATAEARLVAARALFGDEMAAVERALEASAKEGVLPATLAADHLLAAGGKRIRPLAVILSCSCFGAITPIARELAIVSELVHLATLLHDDVIDDGRERRGVTTARRIWGNAVSVLAGDLLLTHALERTHLTGDSPALAELFRTLRTLVDGEVVQLRGRSKLDVREATYQRVVRDKTASLFSWAMRSGARAGGAGPDDIDRFGRFGAQLGTAFQLVDDVLDYAGKPEATGKLLFADLFEGKLTLPLILTIERTPSLVTDVEACRAGDEEAASRLAAAVLASGACDEVRARAVRETESAEGELAAVADSPAKEVLVGVARALAARAK